MESKDILTVGVLYGIRQKDIFFQISEIIKEHSLSSRLRIVCFTIDDINFEMMTVDATVITKDNITQTIENLPNIIYNFASHTRIESIKSMRKLRTSNNITVINPVNRFNQSTILQILKAFPQSEQFLLPFADLSYASAEKYFKEYDSLFLLPERGLSPKNAVIIQKNCGNAIINIGKNVTYCKAGDLYSTLLKMIIGKKYIILKGTDMCILIK